MYCLACELCRSFKSKHHTPHLVMDSLLDKSVLLEVDVICLQAVVVHIKYIMALCMLKWDFCNFPI